MLVSPSQRWLGSYCCSSTACSDRSSRRDPRAKRATASSSMTGRPTRTSTERIATPRSARLANGRSSVRRYGGLVAVGARVELVFKAMGGCRLRPSSLRERPAIKESTRVSMAQWRPERTRQGLFGNHGDPRRAQLFQIANLYIYMQILSFSLTNQNISILNICNMNINIFIYKNIRIGIFRIKFKIAWT